MQSDIVQRLRAASQGMRSHYKVGAVELIPTHTMDEAAAEITRLTEALRAAEERERVLVRLVERAQVNTPDQYVNWHEHARQALAGAKP